MGVEVSEVKGVEEQEGLVKVLVIEKGEEIEGHAEVEEMAAAGGVLRKQADETGDEVIDRDGAEEEENKDGVPNGVEEDGGEGEPGDDGASTVTAQEVKAQHGDGEEEEKEGWGIEEHCWELVSHGQLAAVAKAERDAAEGGYGAGGWGAVVDGGVAAGDGVEFAGDEGGDDGRTAGGEVAAIVEKADG